MRQAVFVVVMIGAAFLGGAVVNGPGLRWVQARLLDYMGLQEGAEITSINLPPTNSDPADPHRQEASSASIQPNSQASTSRSESQGVKERSSGSGGAGSDRAKSSAPLSSAIPPPLPVTGYDSRTCGRQASKTTRCTCAATARFHVRS